MHQLDRIENLLNELIVQKTPIDINEKLKALLLAFHRKQKINAIKIIRELTGLDLKEAKDLVEAGYN